MRWVITILLALLLWLQYRLWVGPGSLADVHHLRQDVARQQQEVQRLQERNDILEAEVRDLKTGLEALEERARQELGMIRQGEVFYQAIGPNADDARPAGPPPEGQGP
jgi:cell division protein FtsB